MSKSMPVTRALSLMIAAMLLLAVPVRSADVPDPLPRPDGKPADMSKPVQVFILMGQSNMLGFGRIGGGEGSLEHAVKNKNLYPYLVDENGVWTVRKDVRNVRVMGSPDKMQTFNNEWLTIKGGAIGPEVGIGHHLGHALDAPVLLVKACIGNRALGWDLLPPGSERFEFGGKIHAGYRDSYSNVPGPWEKGSEPAEPDGGQWYAGWQYDIDVALVKKVLGELDKHYPEAKSYEVAGFFWWQGDKDRGRPYWASRYEPNLVQLIQALRKEFNAPGAKFVLATLGQTNKDNPRGTEKDIIEAMFAVSDAEKYPAFEGNVATVYTHPLSKGGSSSGHYGNNAETYMNVGEGMGKAMAELLKNDK